MKERKDFILDLHLLWLNGLRESGITNMYGAVPYIKEEFNELTDLQAREILTYWMSTFSERHSS